ncbi:hypothetical protein U1Q18_011015 [Sarracenia purpurea var. burkii]
MGVQLHAWCDNTLECLEYERVLVCTEIKEFIFNFCELKVRNIVYHIRCYERMVSSSSSFGSGHFNGPGNSLVIRKQGTLDDLASISQVDESPTTSPRPMRRFQHKVAIETIKETPLQLGYGAPKQRCTNHVLISNMEGITRVIPNTLGYSKDSLDDEVDLGCEKRPYSNLLHQNGNSTWE